MTQHLPAVLRPNGLLYRPRKIAVYSWENDNRYECGAVVLGTHDVVHATELATAAIHAWFDSRLTATNSDVDWFRDGFDDSGRRAWVRDDVRGRAGVMFTADYVD